MSITLKNISDKDAIFVHNGTQYEVAKGKTEVFLDETAKHGIEKCIIQEDLVTGEFISQLIIDDDQKHEVIKTNVLSSDPHATEGVKVGASSPMQKATGVKNMSESGGTTVGAQPITLNLGGSK